MARSHRRFIFALPSRPCKLIILSSPIYTLAFSSSLRPRSLAYAYFFRASTARCKRKMATLQSTLTRALQRLGGRATKFALPNWSESRCFAFSLGKLSRKLTVYPPLGRPIPYPFSADHVHKCPAPLSILASRVGDPGVHSSRPQESPKMPDESRTTPSQTGIKLNLPSEDHSCFIGCRYAEYM
ncbi:hypothetical protein BDW66DRAFT_115097 [Aspergillus desertorum]